MKIDGAAPQFDSRSLDRLDKAAAGASATAGARVSAAGDTGAATDQVELSAEARLAQAAIAVASQETPIRQDVVERMKALLAKGEIGNDPEGLAEALIQHSLTTTDEDR